MCRMSASAELQALVEERTRQLEEKESELEANRRVIQEQEAALSMADTGSALAAEAATMTARSYDNLLTA
eukprot:scaffold663614_cov78-Prasinocladus_malaysianus.AAC.1